MKISAVHKGGIAGAVALIVCVMGSSIVASLADLRTYDGLIVLVVTWVVGFLTSQEKESPKA
jgi:hypothetical protein